MQRINPTDHPIAVLASLHQKCKMYCSIPYYRRFSFNLWAQSGGYTSGGFYGPQAISIVPHTVPVTPCGRYVYHSHSCITLLGQICSTLEPLAPQSLFEVSRHSLPGTQEREVVVCSRRRGYTAVLGFSLSRHRSKLVPES